MSARAASVSAGALGVAAAYVAHGFASAAEKPAGHPLGGQSEGGCPARPEARAAMLLAAKKGKMKAAGCPMHAAPDSAKKSPVYNVYSQEINPENQMPVNANNFPAEGQSRSISVIREHSTIPKGGTEGTWTFPSPQMFYNALKRKGKDEDVTEEDMEHVVSVHNSMNQQTWQAVAAWEERFHCDTCASPALSRFRGRPHDLSPKARLYALLGYEKPFDRHDWVLDRCGTNVRYIIDFYWLENGGGNTAMPPSVTPSAETRTIAIDVRPALDSFGAAWDIVRHAVLGLDLSRTVANKQPLLALKGATPEEVSIVDTIRERIETNCGAQQRRLAGLSKRASEVEHVEAAQSLSLCMGRTFCPLDAEKFVERAQAGDGDGANAAFDGMMGCLRRFELYAEQVQAACAAVEERDAAKQAAEAAAAAAAKARA
jgi:cytochrome c heme-lyase